MADPNGLLKLVAALLRDRQLRMRFNQEPDQLVQEFDLTAAHKTVLYSMKSKDIGDTIEGMFKTFSDEVRGTTPKRREFPPGADEFIEDLSVGRTEYPSPEPQVQSVRPKEVSLAKLDGAPGEKKFAITISGQSFSRDPDASVRVKNLDTGDVLILQSDLVGTFRCSRLIAVVANPVPQGIPPGRYKAIVKNNGTDIWRGDITKPQFEFDFVVNP